MPTITSDETKRNLQLVEARPVEAAEPIEPTNWKAVCLECDWTYQLPPDVHPALLYPRVVVHKSETGHTKLRRRFDLVDVDAGLFVFNGRAGEELEP